MTNLPITWIRLREKVDRWLEDNHLPDDIEVGRFDFLDPHLAKNGSSIHIDADNEKLNITD